jgi:hypothetical protein
MRAIERHHDPEEGDGWAVRLTGVDELLAGVAPAAGGCARSAGPMNSRN